MDCRFSPLSLCWERSILGRAWKNLPWTCQKGMVKKLAIEPYCNTWRMCVFWLKDWYMIYTSYYANYRKFKGMYRISISRTAPNNSYDLQLIKLAPTAELLQNHKSNSITNEEYASVYHNQLLRLENDGYIAKFVKALSTLQELHENIVLLCYEKKGDFCHRHLLAEYLNNNHNANIREL